MLSTILEYIDDVEFVTFDGFDEAVIGVDTRLMRLIYSQNKMIDIIESEWDGFDRMDAIEWVSYNVESLYVGEKTPIICAFED